MILKIFSVRDNAVDAFLQPFFSPTHGSAIRSLTEVVNDENHTFHKHAADYSLYLLGEFDDATGVITVSDPHRILGLIDVLKPPGMHPDNPKY